MTQRIRLESLVKLEENCTKMTEVTEATLNNKTSNLQNDGITKDDPNLLYGMGGGKQALREKRCGEHRLRIDFHSMGKVEDKPQTFVRRRQIIPDGPSGSHHMYSRDWKFEVTYNIFRPQCCESSSRTKGLIALTRKIINITSGGSVSVTETPQQAFLRQTKGDTICNSVVKKAVEQRIEELQVEASKKDRTPIQIANIKSLIKELCAKRCNQGLLFFGLRHELVQRTFATTCD